MNDVTFLDDGVEIGPRYAVECLMIAPFIVTLVGALALIISLH
jgi:hypothetical protein